ncbi:MAG: thiosulfohydrolase SoxB [Pseudophaeobacter sp. bin_em_oilr2.035]|uniref:Thiosulfohydrolase SoxB n=1 Tax=Phaeobacter gallaeciensis TaxID=60890 RepID=A0ABD4X683_9RHOB|nr:thiosulfohydrolase SoxB [Phaeobacter gallaeciensis]MDF1771139.1 thiosulfohydrolase SoxB [Pseudophaeobacter sp. bin_em_oilr2.035]MDE4143931.1 thiosulfohydrolase SoxB [Phaeobacter gallaeciensis]MDE4155707.1 thiosulfohydrolase SoxB [Phaeobacter gallaeciensis]MDE4159895.1 thiosulfohydrolase SoxB [Phaeobacter gallaeciensis]MDE4165011.1 thiosulfohydrolase SoxB [Phaeobacter gallaeciensis]
MISRRDFLQVSMAASALVGASGFGNWGRLAAQQSLTQDQLLEFDTFGNISIIHVTDIHAQLKPIYFREPSINLGVGANKGQVPHITGADFRKAYGIADGSPSAYALTYDDFSSLAKGYGRVGGLDRMSTVINAIRADRPDALLLDGGDTWHGSMTCHKTEGQDMVNVMNALKPDAMTFHWEFTLGSDRVNEIVQDLPFAALGQNIFDSEWDEPAELFKPYKFFERGGSKVAVIGQAFPYMPIANPGWMFPEYSFGIRDEHMQEMVDEVRAAGADVVVCLSHNGFDVDKKMASVVTGIDVILSGHTHDALPEPVLVGKTHIIASGSNGKFVSRIDLDVRDGQMMGLKHKLIPIFSDVIAPDPVVSKLIDEQRAPFKAELEEVVGQTDSLLYRRGNFNGTWDDLICDALMSEREADIAMSPGVRWGPSLVPGDDITREDIWNVTSMSYGAAYRSEMTGEFIKVILEDVADNIFNPDPYYQQGGDMVRIGGMGYRIDINKPQGERITEMTLLKNGEAIDPAKTYMVAGWASVNEGTEGPQIWDVVENHIKKMGTVTVNPNNSVKVVGA